MYLLTAQETRRLDDLSIHRCKIPARRLMNRAGKEVFRVIKKEFENLKRKKIAVFCGPGNNGGDGLVVARHLKKAGAKVQIFLLSPPRKRGSSTYLDSRFRGNDIGGIFDKIGKPDLVIDALFGIGLSRPLAGTPRKWIREMNRLKGVKLAIDIPSGLCADTGKVLGTAFRADITVTFGYPKRGFFPGDGTLSQAHNCVGKLYVRPIGLSPRVIEQLKPQTHLITTSDIKPPLNPRLKTSHKGTYGHVFTVACSLGKIGAGLMAAHTALKAGAGLSTLVLPSGAYRKIDPRALEIMYEPIGPGNSAFFTPKDLPAVLERLKKATVVAIGPGLGAHPHTVHFVHSVLSHYRGPMVIDADGLNAVAANPEILMKRRGLTLLTPHPAEMGRLVGTTTPVVQKNRLKTTASFARRYGVNVLLKGYRSILSLSNGITWINPTGNPAMASAGQGDVLTGIYAGLMAQYLQRTEALLFGCFLHGLVGDLLAQKRRVVLATDVANNLDLGYDKGMSNIKCQI
ncbi:MAG: NAD(P)H-hydrate dehydratase [Deltaproteobacteria bacterium]|nr:NAD(P)H-hydrate dehydratase [Deltaproteobacteria bacterium]